MTFDAWITLIVIAASIVAMATGWIRRPVIALTGALGILVALRVLPAVDAFAGAANEATLTVAALYVTVAAVSNLRIVDPLLARVLGSGRRDSSARSELRLGVLSSLVAALSSMLNNTPIVASVAPATRTWAQRSGDSPSKWLMPISFAAILGGMTTTIGTSTNLVASGLIAESLGDGPLGIFEVTRIGLPAALVGLVVLVVFARPLLPDRADHESETTDNREYEFMATVVDGGGIDGLTVSEAGLRDLQGVYLARIVRGGLSLAPVPPQTRLSGGDSLAFVGDVSRVADITAMDGLVSAEDKHMPVAPDGQHQLWEIIIGATSPLAGRTLREIGFREAYGGAVIAMHRAGARIDRQFGRVRLEVGDDLLVLGDSRFGRNRNSSDFLVVTARDAPQAPPQAWQRLVGALFMGGAIVAAALGLMPLTDAVVSCGLLLVLSRIVSPSEALDAIDRDVVVTMIAALGLGAAAQMSGLAGAVGEALVQLGGGELVTVVGLLAGTMILTELVSNTAAAAIAVPIAIDLAERVGADPRQYAIGVAIMASASFLTPVGYQTNTIVYGLGGYRYSDYWRLGLPISIAVLATVAIALV